MGGRTPVYLQYYQDICFFDNYIVISLTTQSASSIMYLGLAELYKDHLS